MLVADYARSLLDIDQYKPRSDEIERYAEEVSLYDKETGLQYSPKDKETKFIAEHMPIMLDGEATGDEEVSGFRDLERVDTNSARGGMCLVLAEGIALKAPKIQRYTRQLDEVDWPWLQDLIDGTYYEDAATDDAGDDSADEQADDEGDSTGDDTDAEAVDDRPDGPIRPEPAKKFLRDLIAGRPVFGHPSATGGFRLRYGRARNHGFATGGVHPATMHLVDDFLATGTQIKTERPGKAHGVVPVDTIEGPTVKLANGDVRRIDDPAEALEVRNGVVDILDLGEYLVNYGEFVENNHALAPASYVQEWWEQDFAAAGADLQAGLPVRRPHDPRPRPGARMGDRLRLPPPPHVHLPLARRQRRPARCARRRRRRRPRRERGRPRIHRRGRRRRRDGGARPPQHRPRPQQPRIPPRRTPPGRGRTPRPRLDPPRPHPRPRRRPEPHLGPRRPLRPRPELGEGR